MIPKGDVMKKEFKGRRKAVVLSTIVFSLAYSSGAFAFSKTEITNTVEQTAVASQTITKQQMVYDYDEMFKQWLAESEQQVKQLEVAVQQGNQQMFSAGMKTLKSQCKRCHQAYRD